MSKIIYVDLDDTGFRTHLFMNLYLQGYGIMVGKSYITPENGKQPFVDMLASGEFMLKVDMQDYFIQTLSMLLREGFSLGVCTHRGYHEKGERFTRKAMAKHLSMFDHFHVLNPAEHPDKITFLNNLHGEDGYILIDDNPRTVVRDNFTRVGQYSALPANVMLFNQPWNEHIDHPHRISSFDRNHFLENLLPMLD